MYEHYTGVILKKIERHNLNSLLELKQESWHLTHSSSIINFDDQEKWYQSIPSNTLVMMIVEPSKSFNESHLRYMGVVIYSNIDPISRSCDLSGSIFKEFRSNVANVEGAFQCGLDFGFEMLNLERIQAEVLEYHAAAQRLEIDVLGFVVEGRRRKAVYKAGHYFDSLMLGMLRDEWKSSKERRSLNQCCKNISLLHCHKMADQCEHAKATSN